MLQPMNVGTQMAELRASGRAHFALRLPPSCEKM